MVYEITATGEGMESMSLTFKDIPEYRRWSRSVIDVREKTIFIPTLLAWARVLYLVSAWIPLTKQFVQDWGNDFVPSDITVNIVVARQFLDLQPAPNPSVLSILQEIRAEGFPLHDALRHFDGAYVEALRRIDKAF